MAASARQPMSQGEMLSKPRAPSIFAPRPLSQATEISDSEWEDDSPSDSGSEFEDDNDDDCEDESPRGSFDTTSTYDEAPTPQSALQQPVFEVQIQRSSSITGPRGPHLFRTSFDSSPEAYIALQMSPILPKDNIASPKSESHMVPICLDENKPQIETTAPRISLRTSKNRDFVESPQQITSTPLHESCEKLDESEDEDHIDVRSWSTEEVALWLFQSGFEEEIVEKFEKNDVNGAVLFSLKFEDLRELEIPSFGKRRQIWAKLDALRDEGTASPAHTHIESRPSTRNTVRPGTANQGAPRTGTPIAPPSSGRRRRGLKVKNVFDDAVTPAESVSIVAIEQLLPKPHKCHKGEECSKWKKQQRILNELSKEHGFPISPAKGGHIFLAGNLANIQRDSKTEDSTNRPVSDAMPSVVASSDLLGPGQLPSFILDEEQLQKLQKRDPQDNVKQFLSFQHVQASADSPPTPPLETPRFNMAYVPETPTQDCATIPTQPAPLANLQQLPKLAIPRSASAAANPKTTISPCRTALSPPPAPINRHGTPASEMDVPLTAVPSGPVARDASQSVPPGMRFRPQTKHRPGPGTRDPSAWRRASMAKLTPLPEDPAAAAATTTTQSSNLHSPAKAPFRVSTQALYGPGTTHAGHMKKRRTRFLRHQWAEHHFRLTGSTLAMHASARRDDRRPLETLNVEDFSVACASVPAGSKLAAALRSLRITGKDGEKRGLSVEEAAFVFQLIPSAERGRALSSLLKDDSLKTHHFAVKSRDDRIDWMREVLLAKAAKRKEQGFDVSVTGELM